MDKKRHLIEILKNGFFYSTGAIFSQAVAFLLIPIYTRLLSVVQYGTLGIIQITQSLALVILSLGLTNALSRIYYDKGNSFDRIGYTASVFWFLSGIAFFFLPLTVIFGKKINLLLFNGIENSSLISLLIIFISVSVASGTCLSFFQIKIQPKIYSLALSLYTLTYHSIALYLVRNNLGICGILLGGITASIISTVFALKHLKEDIPLSKYDLRIIAILLKSGLPLAVLSMLAWVVDLSDRFFIKHYINLSEVGLYSLSNQIVSILAFINTILVQAVPIYLFKVREDDRQLGEHLQTDLFRYYAIIALFIALILTIFSKEILALLAPAKYFQAYKFIPPLAIAQVFLGGFFILHIGIANAKKFHYLLICFCASGIVNILLNFTLIPTYAGMGAALSTAISYFVLMVSGNYFSQKLYYMHWDYKTPIILFTAAAFLATGTDIFLVGRDKITVVFKGLTLLIYIGTIWLFGLHRIERHAIKNLLFRRRSGTIS